MDNFSSSATAENILRAYTIETQAIQQYLWYAKVATKEGFQQIAAIFEETAEQKKSHCKTLFRFAGGLHREIQLSMQIQPLGDTITNLKTAIEAEKEQSELLFAEYEQIARTEEYKSIAVKLKLFRQIKTFYAERFATLAENIAEGKVFTKSNKVKWICRKCGYISESEQAPQNCPGCEHPQSYFEVLNENYQ